MQESKIVRVLGKIEEKRSGIEKLKEWGKEKEVVTTILSINLDDIEAIHMRETHKGSHGSLKIFEGRKLKKKN